MSRTVIRTAQLSLDVISPIVDLFGTVQNAYTRLGLHDLSLTYAVFYRAMQFRSITPEHKDLIEDSWTLWRRLFLHPQLPVSADLTLTASSRTATPDWHQHAE